MAKKPLGSTYTKSEAAVFWASMTGQNILIGVISASLSYYLQFTLLIPAATVGIIMSIARVWDAFNDPLMGVIVDKVNLKGGKCLPWLKWSPIPIAAFTAMCFWNFDFYGTDGKRNALVLLWAVFAYFMYDFFYTVGDIPLWSLPARMTTDKTARDKLMSIARIFCTVGGGVVMFTFQPIAFAIGQRITFATGCTAAQGEKRGFFWAAVLICALGGLLFLLAGYVCKERVDAEPEENHVTFKENFIIMWRNKPYRQMLLSGILGSARNMVMYVAMPLINYYYAEKYPLRGMLYLALIGGGLFLGQFLANGFTPGIMQRIEKKRLYNLANVVFAVPCLLVLGLYMRFPKEMTHPALIALSALLFSIIGMCNGVLACTQTSMMADAIDLEEYETGHRPDGVFISGLTLIGKLQNGLSTIIGGFAYSIVGFSDAMVAEVNEFIAAGGIPRLEDKYQPYMFILFFLAAVPPAIGSLLAIIPTWKYDMTNARHTEVLEALNERRAKQDTQA
ncbi:MAG: MFS transporter [Oscillospiraceae bacterium]|jgi:Na+/melibiose symporter-like transporter|nr:MFS transporter [Oscillospiraceae bacterium]